MKASIQRATLEQINHYREDYRREMACQIVHDSLHNRRGWVEWHAIALDGKAVGYGAVAVGGPWQGRRTMFEFYLCPGSRTALLDLFELMISQAQVSEVLAQTNDPLLCVGLHQRGEALESEKLLFRDGGPASVQVSGVVVRRIFEGEKVFEHTLEPVGSLALEFEGQVVATGGYLSHYNPPFVDVHMEVKPDMRRRGFGALLVQEVKKAAYQSGLVPCARCDVTNVASIRTLSRASFIPCGHIVRGRVREH